MPEYVILTESSVPIVGIAEGNVIRKISVAGKELVTILPLCLATGAPKTELLRSKVIRDTLVVIVLK